MLDLIRCGKEIPKYNRHSHSGALMRLRLGVLEDDVYFDANLSYLNAWAALSSHDKIDINSAFSSLNKLFDKVLNTRKYIKADSKEDTELLALVDKYKKIMEQEKDKEKKDG
ncbi:hypothetical protein ACFLQL_00220 [Verrucomicrobiota bacterium]